MPDELADECIYTIVHRQRLEEAASDGGMATFREAKPWVSAAKLLAEARRDGRALPIVFADAADCSALLFWGELREVRIDEQGTEYAVASLRPIEGNRAPQQLVLLRSDRTIAPDFIRPYALCRTPAFLSARRPRPASPA